MVYRVIKPFADLQDGNHQYNVGDTFPRIGMLGKVTDKRISELAGSDNKQGAPLIEKVVSPAPKKSNARKPAAHK